jgi:hypothetical protein
VDSVDSLDSVDAAEPARPEGPPERVEHFFVVLGQLLDGALLRGLFVRLTLSNGRVVEGTPSGPASDVAHDDEIDGSGVARHIDVSGLRVDLADVRQAAIVHPASRV